MDVEGSRAAGGAEDPRRLADANLALLTFFLEMVRGMGEFRRAYEIPGAESELASLSPHDLARRLSAPAGAGEALGSVAQAMQELKLHHAALLEGYHEATHEGSRRLLDGLDPEAIRRELGGSRVRVGPISLGVGFRPVLVQAVWEEFLRRYRQLRALEPSDFERFYRDGFRHGYRRFGESRQARPAASAPSAGE
jgi:hypothetical protein